MARTHRARRLPRAWHGFSLIEVLVTLFILSFGMLGLAATQAQALQAQRRADNESQAVQRAAAMLERLRIDRRGAVAGKYELPCSDTPATAASQQVRNWLTGLRLVLPQAQGCIAVAGDEEVATATVRIMWHAHRDTWEQDDDTREYRLQTRL
ncbi:type IV pilus modification protein PilV [Chromohalobacter israelensis]|uniref:Methylation n=1 Tax=Chromohalobacter israelensis (strain ATCC BAA-138 / DSM 3043 / CIP 106854 / NCIMB 13768 / 1H11) TaxID=290398 RepID=Q1R0A6_CHRI1|nr:type IV pilus modification protein PilV [Chromohalobacter salexigens]ABE57852.1 methylation [Chromohalobacter salexigens DSM 3043]